MAKLEKEKDAGKSINRSISVYRKPFDIVLYGTNVRAAVKEDEARAAFEDYGEIKEIRVYVHLGRKKILVNFENK